MVHERIQKSSGQSSSQKKHTPLVPPLSEEPTQASSQSSYKVNISALPSKEERDAIKRKLFGNLTETNEVQSKRLEFSSVVGTNIQAKLTIGAPGDKYEQEADRVAAQVVNQINAPVAQQKSQNLQREAIPEEEKLQMKPMLQLQSGVGNVAVPDELESSIQQARSGRQPLADNIRQPMEQAFGADFSGVKVHTDAQSDQLNQSIQAKAFTTGQDVFFRSGEYNPGSRGGQELLAHELTHVVQQTRGTINRMYSPTSATQEAAKALFIEDTTLMKHLIAKDDILGSNNSDSRKAWAIDNHKNRPDSAGRNTLIIIKDKTIYDSITQGTYFSDFVKSLINDNKQPARYSTIILADQIFMILETRQEYTGGATDYSYEEKAAQPVMFEGNFNGIDFIIDHYKAT